MLTALGFVAVSAAPPQGRDALAAGRHQHRHELRARRARAQLRRGARRVGLRARPEGRRTCPPPWRAPSSSRSRVSCRPSGPTRCKIPSVKGVGGSLIYFIEEGSAEEVWHHEFTQPVPTEASAALAAARTDGSHRADDAIRGVPVLAALLRGAVRRGEDAADRDRRHARARAEPGHRVAGPRAAHYAERLDGRANAVGAILPALHGRGRAALGLRDARTSLRRPKRRTPTVCRCSTSRTTTTKTSKRSSAWRRSWSSGWRKLNILYDRDGSAEYFQFYSRAFAKRVFFEIVERRGYEAYGAANASIRLAAQARFKA